MPPQGSEAKVDVGLGGALEVFGLRDVEVFREAGQDMKVLVGWGGDTIVVAFRGTASFANVLNDIQARAVHPFCRCLLTFDAASCGHLVLCIAASSSTRCCLIWSPMSITTNSCAQRHQQADFTL